MTTQDKPAVGPLSAESVKLLVKGDLLRCDRWNGEMFTAGREYAVVSIDADGDPVLISDEGESVPVCLIHQFTFVRRPAPTAPADVSTKPLETNTSAGRVKEAAKNEHVTAPVKAGGSERWTEDMEREKREADYERGFRHGKEEALRPQPSGETLQSLAQAFEDAMEGSHGAWAVSGDYSPLSATTVADKIQADTDAKLTDCPSGETREDRLSAALIALVEHFERVDAGSEDKAAIQAACAVWADVKRDKALSTTPAQSEAQDEGAAGKWPEVTDQWAETYCDLTGQNPDGAQVSFIGDGAVTTTFRDKAKRQIEAMLCAAPKAAVRAISPHPSPTPAADADRVRIAVEAIQAEINAPLTGPTHGAWDRGRIAGLKEALATLKAEGK